MGSLIGIYKCAILWCDFGVVFDFCFAKMFSAAIFETFLSQRYGDFWMLQLVISQLILIILISFDSYTSFKKCNSFVTFSLIINAVLLISCMFF